jgi:putative oxidoreductase
MARWAQPVHLVAGFIFILGGIAKFAANGLEVRAFASFGLPFPHVFVVLIGVIEIAGGVLLMMGVFTRPTALVLAAVMVGAIAFSGIGHGDVVPSLTLAPLLLAATLFLLWVEDDPPAAGRLRTR